MRKTTARRRSNSPERIVAYYPRIVTKTDKAYYYNNKESKANQHLASSTHHWKRQIDKCYLEKLKFNSKLRNKNILKESII